MMIYYPYNNIIIYDQSIVYINNYANCCKSAMNGVLC